MAYARMDLPGDATWTRMWQCDAPIDLLALQATTGSPLGPKRGDFAYVTSISQYFFCIESGIFVQLSEMAYYPIDLTSPSELTGYSTGTWTPVIGGAGGTSGQTYSAQEGWYVKLGRMVYVGFNVQLSAKGTITGNVQIQGLPFPSAATPPAENAYCTTGFNSLVNNTIAITGFQLINTSIIALFAQTAAATASFGTPVVTADLNNTSHFAGTCIYRAAS